MYSSKKVIENHFCKARKISTISSTMKHVIRTLTTMEVLEAKINSGSACQIQFQPRRWSSSTQTAQSSLGPNFTKSQAVSMIEKLTVEERKLFLKELKKTVYPNDSVSTAKPTRSELRQLAYHNSLPFIGFGFLDNLVMIVAGEYIDLTLGATLSISTMAAAALGNTLSDMLGVGSAWYVESWASKIGAHPPDLSAEQLEMNSSRVAANLGRAVGVMVGCLLGMFPLLFITTEEKEK